LGSFVANQGSPKLGSFRRGFVLTTMPVAITAGLKHLAIGSARNIPYPNI
jgi:hypothetical protein